MKATALAERLQTRWLGRSLHLHDRTGSTNEDLLKLARCGAASGTVVVADTQDAGRGRLGRQWHSPPGHNLYCSMLLRLRIDVDRMASLTVLTGVVLAQAIEAHGELAARIKWPNDIWIDDAKVAGILGELCLDGGDPAIVIGFGVNVNGSREDLPPELRSTASSLAHARSGRPLDRIDLLAEILRRQERAVETFEQAGLAPFVAEANRLSALAGREIRVQLAEGECIGRVRGILEDGRLEIETDAGRGLAIASGEVTLVRPLRGEGAGGHPGEGRQAGC